MKNAGEGEVRKLMHIVYFYLPSITETARQALGPTQTAIPEIVLQREVVPTEAAQQVRT